MSVWVYMKTYTYSTHDVCYGNIILHIYVCYQNIYVCYVCMYEDATSARLCVCVRARSRVRACVCSCVCVCVCVCENDMLRVHIYIQSAAHSEWCHHCLYYSLYYMICCVCTSAIRRSSD